MLRPRIAIATLFLSSVLGFAAAQSPSPSEPPVKIAFADTDLADVLRFYAQLTHKKVWMDPALSGRKVSVVTPGIVPHAEGIAFIRRTLSAAGIDVQDRGDSEVFASAASPLIQNLLPSPAEPSPPRSGPGWRYRRVAPKPSPTPSI